MGIFSSKKKTVVGLTTVPLIPEQTMFNESVIGAIFSNTNIAQSISAELRNGWVGKANYYYRESKKHLSSQAGTAVFTSITNNTQTLDNTLSSILGVPLTIIESFYGAYDVTYSAYIYFIEQGYTYNINDNSVIGYLPNNEVVYFDYCSINDNNELEIHYSNLEKTEEYIELVNSFIEYTGEYFQALYVNNLDDSLNVFLYDLSANQYPELNKAQSTKTYNDYFPSIVIKKDKKDTYNSGTEYEKKAKRLLSKMGVDLAYITEQFNTNENGEQDVVDDVFITFGLNIQDKYPGSIKYLYEYFYLIAQDTLDSKAQFDAWKGAASNYPYENYIKFKDDQFNTYIGFNYISFSVKSGVIPSEYFRETILVRPGIKVTGIDTTAEYEQSSLILRKRLTPDTYEEIIVNGLYQATDVVAGKLVIRTLEDSLLEPTPENPADSGFYIPVSKTVVDRLSLIERKQVLYASFIAPVYTIQIIKIKWYQRGAFRILLIIIAIVWTYFTSGSDGGSALQIAVGAASQIITAIIIGQLLRVAVDILGIENALILAIIATAIAVYNGGYSSDGLMWAQQLLQLATISFNAISSEIQDEFVKLQNEISNFLQDAREIQEDIDNAAALLDNSKYSFLDVASGRMYFNPYETPDQFYSRSAYDQNPGVKSFDMLYNYVDRMLKLPEHRYV